jgi:hypothetical protein
MHPTRGTHKATSGLLIATHVRLPIKETAACRSRLAPQEKTLEKRDFSAEVNKHDSLAVRLLFLVLGTVLLLIGIATVLLPVLPTLPIMLAAAACYARASVRFYNWLLNHRYFGPAILEWREHRSIPFRLKCGSIALMALTLGIAVVYFVTEREMRIALAALGAVLGIALYRIPSRDRPRQ